MEISARELRIGNLLQGEPFQNVNQGTYSDGVFAITGYGISEMEREHLWKAEPIPLTNEWLYKFEFIKEIRESDGIFKRREFSRKKGIHKVTTFCIEPLKGKYIEISGETEEGDFSVIKKVKYVHQLQNLYFALTGEELKYDIS